MLRIISQRAAGLRYPLFASLTLSFASFGDAYLYPFLPQYAEVMDIPVVWIGLLLSINRFIRIAFNPVVINLFARHGVRPVTIAASVMAIVSTLGYGLGWGIISLFLFRIIWGMAFAILRISVLAYAFQHEHIGTSLGIGKAVQEAGPMLALWFGPLLLNYFSPSTTFLILGMVSVPSLLYAISLPDLKYLPPGRIRISFGWPSLFNSMVFAVSFIIQGVLIIVIGLLLTKNNVYLGNWEVMAVAAGYLAYRRISFMLFSPISGAVADWVGIEKVFNFSLLMIVAGLILLLMGWETTGLVMVFTFNSVNSTMAPGGASGNRPDKIKAAAVNAGWRDIGVATGTLTGGLLLSGVFLVETFTIAIFIISALLIIHLRKTTTG
ncbi:MAG TPA: MFS transporter [Chitinophagaceae bacterium]|nr:MFS transporter [Chitinophagaceae bacterium]